MFEFTYQHLHHDSDVSDLCGSREDLARNLGLAGLHFHDNCAIRYRLMLVLNGYQFAAARHHTAVLLRGRHGVVVRMCGEAIAPNVSNTSMKAWLRAMPVQTARSLLAIHGHDIDEPVTLVREIPTGEKYQSIIDGYTRAGFLILDPVAAPYSKKLPGLGGESLPCTLLIRRVGRETETSIRGAEARALRESLSCIDARTVELEEKCPCRRDDNDWPGESDTVALLAD